LKARMSSQAASPDTRDLDLETHVTDDHHQAVKLWLRLLSCTNKIETAIRRRLRERFDTSLARFDLMAQLERCPEGLKMNELSQRMMVTGSNVTGLTDQLESKGLVVRETAAGAVDARGTQAFFGDGARTRNLGDRAAGRAWRDRKRSNLSPSGEPEGASEPGRTYFGRRWATIRIERLVIKGEAPQREASLS